MADADEYGAQVTKQGSLVRQLKKDGAEPEKIKAEVDKLKNMKGELEKLLKAQSASEPQLNRAAFDQMLVRKFFVVPSFEIHGGVAGLFDLGPPACGLKANILNMWREHFVLQENMLEMDCTNLTPHNVLKTSGHVDRFTDLMVKDDVTGVCARADKLLEDAIDHLIDNNPTMSQAEKDEHLLIQRQADAYKPEEIDVLLKKYDVKSPEGNPFGASFPFNLMFKTTIGPEGTSDAYLRPETAQGLFVNFKRLVEYNAGKLPFAAAQIGLGFRNEISPKGGLLRVREFCMAEIEHFCDPNDKAYPRFELVKDKVLTLFSSDNQLSTGKTEQMTIGEAVGKKMVDNETLGFFLARTQIFCERIGMDPARIRFRQHLKTEMAHYACDCWDLEVKTSYGWMECAGHADRSAYDLTVHAKATNTDLVATKMLSKPQTVEIAKIKLNRKQLGMVFKAEQRAVANAIDDLAQSWANFEPFAAKLEADGKAEIAGFEVTKDMFSYEKKNKTIHEVKYTPSVIEPSFGIGRILYSLLEHCFDIRENDEQRTFLKFKPVVAPIKVAVLALQKDKQFEPIISDLKASLMDLNLSSRIDDSTASLGKRYARADEVGIPFAITVDFDTVSSSTVTLRDRDTMQQIRAKISDIVGLLKALCTEKMVWEDVVAKYGLVAGADEEGEEGEKKPQGKTFIQSTGRGRFSRPTVV
ncbi:hypothetical protein TrVE_jg12640 [Triparma verrucosa]|uniref:glycine--tRNA ligase n=1 Tax=Triparma verrucosa TaxID=1606542 RepID=A0A9W7FBL1_9STRA|nr:hypothetical protein TrVE_jg12640 [Triparma verrucosa]